MEKKKLGRPTLNGEAKTAKLTLRLTENEYNEICRISNRLGVTRTEVIIEAVRMYNQIKI